MCIDPQGRDRVRSPKTALNQTLRPDARSKSSKLTGQVQPTRRSLTSSLPKSSGPGRQNGFFFDGRRGGGDGLLAFEALGKLAGRAIIISLIDGLVDAASTWLNDG